MSKEYEIVDSVDKLEEAIKKVREAQKEFATFSQEQVDSIFKAASYSSKQSKNSSCKVSS